MNQKITDGVYLNILQTNQFKTIRLTVQLIAPVTADGMTRRSLLASVLGASSQAYRDQVAIANELQAMYGAGFNMNAYRQGNLAIFSISMRIVSPQYLRDTIDLQEQAIAFIGQLLLHPDVVEGQFNPGIFNREKENLVRYIESVADDKQSYAAVELRKLYFKDATQQIPNYGDAADLATITPDELYAYYQSMIANDRVQMTFVGNIDEAKTVADLVQLPFAPRNVELPTIFYQQSLYPQVQTKTEVQTVQQGKLNMAYQMPAYFYQADYYATMVTNALFGGTPLSLLFTNVREKASLAYYASSAIDAFRGVITVQTGIESRQKDRVLEIIEAQRQRIIAGDFEQAVFEQTKLALINQFKSSLDSAAYLGQQQFNRLFVPETEIDAERFTQAILAVSKQAVQEQAAKMQLQAIYFLKGVDTDEA
ncbi:insulinase family protein [Latilactobacillus curvatus]|uniref:EF-P 5-aminopentanol modification-associated protein YfmF n=1 Tax=Latilactobacillus curvatus TaxID=28038 RepID=UPI000B621A73|nr:pitrilysin family protein [Latilactobacillus curvatus]ASN62514.1 peptidase M16 [Latilactobacillus curvatus]MCM6843125.1 insulinase family protein [Latilactobacillus curvatus]MCM6861979.1 insulinase family protein [Latilactobacillus curvatus]MCM6869290.1 insulinase family protein [Latilactobacillus curvatus]MCP8863354.1 insulinase family protein [Latilactobacillus curvatus]